MRRFILDDDDGAGAGQDLFATALIAMILLTASFLMSLGPQKIDKTDKLPDDYSQQFFILSKNENSITVRTSAKKCLNINPSNIVEGSYIYTPRGIIQFPNPPSKDYITPSSEEVTVIVAQNCLCISDQIPYWGDCNAPTTP